MKQSQPLMNKDWVSQMLEASFPNTAPVTDVETVERLVLEHNWSMSEYEDLLSYFEDIENEHLYKRMIALNRMIVSLLKTGKTNEF